MIWVEFPSKLPDDMSFDYKYTPWFPVEHTETPKPEQPPLPTPEQLKQWKEAFFQLEDRVREQQFQKARLRALVEDVAKLAGVRIKILEEGE